MPYSLEITETDADAIAWVGHRYAWSVALQDLGYAEPGLHEVPESDAWELIAAFEEDTVGGHSPFPLLNPQGDLHTRLHEFWSRII